MANENSTYADTTAEYHDEGSGEMVEVYHPTPDALEGDRETMLVREDRAHLYERVEDSE
jgi:hypothetical protein